MKLDAALERAVHDRERRLLVAADLVHERLVVGLAERHRAEAEDGNLEAARSEVAMFHGRWSYSALAAFATPCPASMIPCAVASACPMPESGGTIFAAERTAPTMSP